MSRNFLHIAVLVGIVGQTMAMESQLPPEDIFEAHINKMDELFRQANREGDVLALDCYRITEDLEQGKLSAIASDAPEFQRLLAQGIITPEGRLPKTIADGFWQLRDTEALEIVARKLAALKKINAAKNYVESLYCQVDAVQDFTAAECINDIKNLTEGLKSRVRKTDKRYARLHAGGIITAQGKLKKHVRKAFEIVNKNRKQ